MNEQQVKNVKLALKLAAGLSALFALIGAIITLASSSKMLEGSSNAVKAFYPGNDMARFGAFAAFICSVLFVVIEVMIRSKEKAFAFVMGISSVLGFIGCFLSSVTALMEATSASGARGAMTTGCVFILIAAVVVLACVVVMLVQPMMANKAPYGYGQMPMQQYPNQQMPNQQYPGQPYPNQQYPNQPYPNQQIPNQQYPNQQMPNQQTPPQQYPNQQDNNYTQQ